MQRYLLILHILYFIVLAPPHSLNIVTRLTNPVQWCCDSVHAPVLVHSNLATIEGAIIINIDEPTRSHLCEESHTFNFVKLSYQVTIMQMPKSCNKQGVSV